MPRINRTLCLAVAVCFLAPCTDPAVEAQTISVELVGTFDYPRPGTLTMQIDFPGAVATVPRAINDSGYIVGLWRDNRYLHAFVMQLPDTFITYDLPGASGTYFTGINNAGLICGAYSDQRFNSHILIAQLVVQ